MVPIDGGPGAAIATLMMIMLSLLATTATMTKCVDGVTF